jgi:glutathione S-transferase
MPGHKVNCLFEELGVKYTLHKIDISKNTQKEPWYLEINRTLLPRPCSQPTRLTITANGRIPAIVDKTSGKEKRIFEGMAIMLYMCEKYDKQHTLSFEYDTDEYWEMVEWMVWMQSGIGPMQVRRAAPKAWSDNAVC